MIAYFIKLLIFNFGYSFVMGVIITLPMLLFIPFMNEDKEEPHPLMMVVGLVLGGVVILGQGFIISRATEMSLIADPSRSAFLWYLVGFMFSTPLAIIKARDDNKYNWLGIPLSYMFYLIGVFTDFDNIDIINKVASYLYVA